jgi:hypothetical protein
MPDTMTNRDRFLTVMEYGAPDRLPHYEVGVWPQAIDRWRAEGLDPSAHHWDWFEGDPAFNMDYREYVPVHYDMIPAFEHKVIERTDKYEVFQDSKGVVHRALIEGTSGACAWTPT